MESLSDKVHFSIVPTSFLNDIHEEVSFIKEHISQNHEKDGHPGWVNKKEGSKRLDVCQKTFDKYLKQGIIGYSRFGGKIMIKVAELENHLEKHYLKKSVR